MSATRTDTSLVGFFLTRRRQKTSELERRRRSGRKAHELLRDHASHTDSDNVQAPVLGPAEKVEQLDNIERHLARRVGPAGRVAPPDSSVVKDEDGVSR